MRIVSLCPSITETLIDFGLADRLVGITRYCIHPEAVVRGIRKVGGTKNPDVPAILALAPDLVLMNAEENRKEDYEVLSSTLSVDVSMPKTIGEVPAELVRLGRRLGVEGVAERRATELEAALEALDRARASFSFAYLIWKKPWMAVGRETYVSDLFTRAGGTNVYAGEADRYPEITLESLAGRAPDLVLLPDEPYPFAEEHRREIRAVLNARIEIVSGDDCCWHGVRSIRGAKLVASLV